MAVRVSPFVLAFLIPGSVAAAPVWVADMEGGDLSQWSGVLNESVDGVTYAQVSGEQAAQGVSAAKIELHNDAVWPNGLKRVELNHSPAMGRTAEGAALFFAWSFYLPDTLTVEPSQQIGYWESNSSYQQMMAFEVSGERMSFSTRQPNNVVQWEQEGVATAGVWHRVAMRVLWSKDPAVGAVDVWFDGVQVVTAAAAKTLADDNPHFTQVGLLRGQVEFMDVPTIYIDDAVEGDSLEDVHPEPPLPPGETTTDGETGVGSSGAGSTGVGESGGGETGIGSSGAGETGGPPPGATSGGATSVPTSGGEAPTTAATAPETGSTSGTIDDDTSGCGCTTGAPGAFAWLGLAGLGRRRRSRRSDGCGPRG